MKGMPTNKGGSGMTCTKCGGKGHSAANCSSGKGGYGGGGKKK